jgi:toxin ParE1/3/4
MVQRIWTQPALSDLEAIADSIALDNLTAAKSLVRRVFLHVEQLQSQPEIGSVVWELRHSPYRQIVEPPCRIFYRLNGTSIHVLHVMRGEMRLRKQRLVSRGRPAS